MNEQFMVNSNRGNMTLRPKSLKKKAIWKVVLLLVALCGLSIMTTDMTESGTSPFSPFRLLESVSRSLGCNTTWYHNIEDYRVYWEELFPGGYDYSSLLRASRRVVPPTEDHVAYLLPVMSCPEDEKFNPAYDLSYDPGHSFYDAAAVLKHSICTAHEESKYNFTMYAVVHPRAIECVEPNGEVYDRVKALEELGYWVYIYGEPVNEWEIEDPYLKNNINNDVGIRDLIRLYMYNVIRHEIAVMLDFTTLMLKPMDAEYDQFLQSDVQAMYSRDYAPNTPATEFNQGADMNFFMVKPAYDEFYNVIDEYAHTPYDANLGWGSRGVAKFPGSMGASGFLTDRYMDPTKHIEMDKCVVGNGAQNPRDNNGVCRDTTAECEDCRQKDISEIKVAEMITVCGAPWDCYYDDNWDADTKNLCDAYHTTWFNLRNDFEANWHNGPRAPRIGKFKESIFQGLCRAKGPMNYYRLIPDKSSAPGGCSTQKTTTSISGVLRSEGFPRRQTIQFDMSTPKTTGSVEGCMEGLIKSSDFLPPLNIGIVIDVSYSTHKPFGGSPVGDVNGDGDADTILDAEIASVIALLEALVETPGLDNSNVNIGLITFSTYADYLGNYGIADTTDPTKVNPFLKSHLLNLGYDAYTHFDDALDKAIVYFKAAPANRQNIMFFLSDGKPNVPGDGDNEYRGGRFVNNRKDALIYDSEIEALDALEVKRVAIGVGPLSDIRRGFGLDMIDNTIDPETRVRVDQVTTTDGLTNIIKRNPVIANIIDLKVFVNNRLDTNFGINDVKTGPLGFYFGPLALKGLLPFSGRRNKVSATITVDVDGDASTTDDQLVLSRTNYIDGSLTELTPDSWA